MPLPHRMKGEGREQRERRRKERSEKERKEKNIKPTTKHPAKKKIQELFLSQRLSQFVSRTRDGFLQLLP